MVKLTTINEVNGHLRRDTNYDDQDLTVKIVAASAAVLNHLGVDDDYYEDSNGDQQPPNLVKYAVIVLVADMYEKRDGSEGSWKGGLLPAPVRALLGPLRDPIMA